MANTKAGPLTIKDARIIFRNFEGREGQYNREGDRNFAVVLDQAQAEILAEDGWNVKFPQPREDGEIRDPYMQVSVSFKNRPPTIVMITSRGRTNLTEGNCVLLDWAEIAMVDMIVHPYEWTVGGRTGVKAYLRSIYVTIREDELELKYADVPEALPAGRDHDIIDAEVIEMPRAIEGRR